MKRTGIWMTAAALLWIPLAASADQHMTGIEHAKEVASEHAVGLWTQSGESAPAAVPEPSSLLLFATGTLMARAVVRRRGMGTPE